MTQRSGLVTVAVLLSVTPFVGRAAPRPLELNDYRALIQISSPQFSPDGEWIAFLTIRPDFVYDRYDATLRVVSAKGGPTYTLVQGMSDLHMPRWSPDGRSIKFIATVGDQKAQIYTVPAAGGTPAQLGDAPNGVEQIALSPDGKTLAYVTADDSPLSNEDRRTHQDLFTIHDDDYLVKKVSVPAHLWLLDVVTGKARQLTYGATSVLETEPPIGGSVSAPSWSADGRWIAYARQEDADDGDSDRTRIAVVDVLSGTEHTLTTQRSYEYMSRFAPQGLAIAYLYPHGPGPVSDMDLFTVSAGGGMARDVSANLDRNLLDFDWLPDGSGLVVMAHDHTRTHLYVQPVEGDGHALNLGRLNALEVAVSPKGALAIVADTAKEPSELYLLRTPDSPPEHLTDFNRQLHALAFPRSVEVQWRAPDGEFNDGILTYPNGYEAGQRYPLVVFSHGGPEAASIEHFDELELGPLRELFAARGYLIFEPNYRGSDNLGNAHEHAIYRDPGIGPDRDVISGIRMLQREAQVDPSRIAAVGHSYGGFITAWLIAHQHFWRCAVVADGVLDWAEEYELSGAGNLAWTRDSLGGGPWDKASAALYRTSSPITYARDITTPTLILSGTDDTTVPITESFALYHSLASRHVPVKFLGIPGADHFPQDPVHRELFYRAIFDWVAEHLGS
jgi:dipeptidyl aminopeptidase/acylaminoacyl peptidase